MLRIEIRSPKLVWTAVPVFDRPQLPELSQDRNVGDARLGRLVFIPWNAFDEKRHRK